LLDHEVMQRELRRVAERNQGLVTQATVRMLLQLEPAGSFQDRYRAIELAAELGVDTVRVRAPARSRERFDRFVAAVRCELPQIDLAVVEVEAERG